MPSASWTLPAVAANVSLARQSVTDFARAHEVPEPCRRDLRIAVTEAVSNAIVHAFRDRCEPGTVTVSVSVAPAHVDIVVADDGSGLAPRRDSPGMGIGLRLIRTLAHEADHRVPPDGGTELWMRFRYAR